MDVDGDILLSINILLRSINWLAFWQQILIRRAWYFTKLLSCMVMEER